MKASSRSDPRSKVIVIAGGGTGGHIYPGIAVADALRNIVPELRVVFAGSPRGLESKVVPAHVAPDGSSYELRLLDVQPMVGGGTERALRGGLIAAKATAASLALLRELRPAAVLAVGGYAAGPLSLAAAASRIPLALLEPNAAMGLTNRWLSHFAKRAYVAFPEVARQFDPGVARALGVPLRSAFRPTEGPRDGKRRVLVLGGSQGAKALNERVPQAIGVLAREGMTLEITHQVGVGREAETENLYQIESVHTARVVPFIDDVAEALTIADVVIARAGAGTLAEITAVGRPSILIPFPHAAGDHQAKNAASLASQGAAVTLREEAADPVRIAIELRRLFGDRDALAKMAACARSAGRPNAADDVAHDLLDLAHLLPVPAKKPTRIRELCGSVRLALGGGR